MITVYVICDPRYGECIFNHGLTFKHPPFYVGVSTDFWRRKRQHELGDSGVNRLKRHIIEFIEKEKLSPVYEVYHVFKTYEEAYACEKRLIDIMGRIDKNTGHLANNTDGGRGTKGRIKEYSTPRPERSKRTFVQRTKEQKTISALKGVENMRNNGNLLIRSNKIAYTRRENSKNEIKDIIKKDTKVKIIKYQGIKSGKHYKALLECAVHGRYYIRHDLIKSYLKNNRSTCSNCRLEK